MGSYNSSQSRTSSSSDGLNNSSTTSSRVKRSRRLIEKLRSRQLSKTDLMVQTTDGAIDPIKELRVAQDPDEGETQNRDRTTADVGECQ